MKKRDLDLAYAAGLYEGEGTVHLAKTGAVHVQITMTDREPLLRMQRIFGGRLHGPNNTGRKPGWRPAFAWRLSSWSEVENIYLLLGAYLSPRRLAQFDSVFARKPPAERLGRGSHNRRKTCCPNGHPYDVVRVLPNGGVRRRCRKCANERRNELRQTQRSK